MKAREAVFETALAITIAQGVTSYISGFISPILVVGLMATVIYWNE